MSSIYRSLKDENFPAESKEFIERTLKESKNSISTLVQNPTANNDTFFMYLDAISFRSVFKIISKTIEILSQDPKSRGFHKNLKETIEFTVTLPNVVKKHEEARHKEEMLVLEELMQMCVKQIPRGGSLKPDYDWIWRNDKAFQDRSIIGLRAAKGVIYEVVEKYSLEEMEKKDSRFGDLLKKNFREFKLNALLADKKINHEIVHLLKQKVMRHYELDRIRYFSCPVRAAPAQNWLEFKSTSLLKVTSPVPSVFFSTLELAV